MEKSKSEDLKKVVQEVMEEHKDTLSKLDDNPPTVTDYKKAYEECVTELQRYQKVLTSKNLEILRLASIIARQEGVLNG